MRTSKTLSWLLRHGSESVHLPMRPDGFARVVTTSSSGAHLAGPIVWEAFREHPSRYKINLYYQSKLVSVHVWPLEQC